MENEYALYFRKYEGKIIHCRTSKNLSEAKSIYTQ